jgi:hypothetical protein
MNNALLSPLKQLLHGITRYCVQWMVKSVTFYSCYITTCKYSIYFYIITVLCAHLLELLAMTCQRYTVFRKTQANGFCLIISAGGYTAVFLLPSDKSMYGISLNFSCHVWAFDKRSLGKLIKESRALLKGRSVQRQTLCFIITPGGKWIDDILFFQS